MDASVSAVEIVDLPASDRERAVPVLLESFEGIYRWHAKRTLRDVSRVRVAERSGRLVGVAMLERLLPEVGYVYYIAVAAASRQTGIGGRLLDDAIEGFRSTGAQVIYAAVRSDNEPSLRLFRSRGLRPVERKELGFREGGLGAWGLRSRMRLVYGEVLLGRRLEEVSGSPGGGPAAPSARRQVGTDAGPNAVSPVSNSAASEPVRSGSA